MAPAEPAPATLTLPPEFFSGGALVAADLQQRYGLSPLQVQALQAMRPLRGDIEQLTRRRFNSPEAAVAAAYALMERLFAQAPALREALEFGGQAYRAADGSWRLSLPMVAVDDQSISPGSFRRVSAPVDDTSAFWHTHPSTPPGPGNAAGFSFNDLVATLQSGRALYVYQNGRAYRMTLGEAWRAMDRAERDAIGRRVVALATTVRSAGPASEAGREALRELRALLQRGLVEVTVFERSGVNPAAGQSVQVMPVSLRTDAGSVQLIPNTRPPQPWPPGDGGR